MLYEILLKGCSNMKINLNEMKIKEIAFESFANKGYEGTNMREICKKAGIKTPTLYYYFESKEKLFFTILNEVIEMFIKYNTDPDFFKSIEQTKEVEEKLFLIYTRRMNFYQNYRKEYKFLYRFMVFYPEEFEKDILNCYLELGNTINKAYEFIYDELMEKKIVAKEQLNEFIGEYNAFINTNVIHHFFYYKEVDLLHIRNQWKKFWKYIK